MIKNEPSGSFNWTPGRLAVFSMLDSDGRRGHTEGRISSPGGIDVLKTKTWDQPADADDGFRLLTCRYRPRALSKKNETWDLWWPQVGPSKELHAAFYGKAGRPIPWEEFKARYLAEMQGAEQQESITVLAERAAAGRTITLLCSSACTDGLHCHRYLLRQLIEERIPQVEAAAPAAG
jgi:uncharacterized protein YeaO (DUF488 family)